MKGLSNALETNLKRRKEELASEDIFGAKHQQMELEQAKRELQNAIKQIESINNTMKQNERQLEENRRKVQELAESIEEKKNDENSITKRLLGEAEVMEQLLIEKKILNEKKDDCERKIRNLGSMPLKEVGEWKQKNLSAGHLKKNLKKVNEELKKFNVNQKAKDQYINFTEQRERLKTRKETLDQDADRIGQLIEILDKKKQETIHNTFDGVGKIFETTFAQLVPNGAAQLKLIKADSNSSTSNPEERHKGILIQASFNRNDTMFPISQLSGGQRSLIALTLILAIQQLDPAPFYLLDEVDAHLDARSRVAVANLIKQRAHGESSQQFICSTFKNEFCQIADKAYGVTFHARESQINPISKSEALKTIREEAAARPQRPAQEVTSSDSENRSQQESDPE